MFHWRMFRKLCAGCANMEAGMDISWRRNYADKRHPSRILYLGPDQRPVTPDPSADSFRSWIRHTGSIRGAWPTVGEPLP